MNEVFLDLVRELIPALYPKVVDMVGEETADRLLDIVTEALDGRFNDNSGDRGSDSGVILDSNTVEHRENENDSSQDSGGNEGSRGEIDKRTVRTDGFPDEREDRGDGIPNKRVYIPGDGTD
jgi:hypothetical protein